MKSIIILLLTVACFASCKKGDEYTCGQYQTDVNAQSILIGETWTKRFENAQEAREYEIKCENKYKDDIEKGGDYKCILK